MHVTHSLLKARLAVLQQVTVRLWCYSGQLWLLFRLLRRFKLTCNKTTEVTLLFQIRSTGLDFACPSRTQSHKRTFCCSALTVILCCKTRRLNYRAFGINLSWSQQKLENVAIDDVLPLRAARRDAIANLKCFWATRDLISMVTFTFTMRRHLIWLASAPSISSRLATCGWVRFPCAQCRIYEGWVRTLILF